MALLFASTCGDYYLGNNSLITSDFDALSGTVTVSNAAARFPAALNAAGFAISASAYVAKNFGANPGPVLIPMFSMSVGSYPSGPKSLLQLLDLSTVQVSLGIDSLGRLAFYRGSASSGTQIGPNSGSTLYGTNVYHRLSIQVTINGSTGAVALYLDGSATPLITATGLNTQASANAYINQMRLGDSDAGGFTSQLDDVYLLDNTGGSLNAILGDRKLITAMPSGTGSSTQWNPTGFANNYQCVNSIPPNPSDFVATSTVNNVDTYAYQPVTFTGSADFALLQASVEKDDSATHTIQLNSHSASTDAFSASFTVPSSYVYTGIVGLFITDPNTSSPWTQSGLNSANWGIKLIS